MTDDHRNCDEDFTAMENLVSENNFSEAINVFKAWKKLMERHLKIEEEILFPKTEEKLGGRIGPISVMLMEHEQMKIIFNQMQNAIEEKNKNKFLGLSDSCMMLIQQHNMKEEQILYPIIDQALNPELHSVINLMNL